MDEFAVSLWGASDQGGRATAGWDAGGDLCPVWWPRRSQAARNRPRPPGAPVDLIAADRIYAALTLLATSFELGDDRLVREVQTVAVAHVVEGAAVLARGSQTAWEPGEDVCPTWPLGCSLAAGSSPGLPAGAQGVSPRAIALLDALGLLQAYSLSARIADRSARHASTVAIGGALVEHARAVALAFG